MNLPAPIQITSLQDEREDQTEMLKQIDKARRKLRWRRQEGDEFIAEKLDRVEEGLRDG